MANRTDIRISDALGAVLTDSNWNPAPVTGADKVAQRFVYFLTTPVGTVPGRPNDGTGFVDAVESYRSEFDLFAAFSIAEPEAARAVRTCEEDDDALSDRYGWCRLDSVAVADGSATFYVTLAAADGSTPSEAVSFTVET